MATQRENVSLPEFGDLRMKSYSIDGNDIRAFYDAGGALVFVIDDAIAENKPNALLVINSDGGRKWDDILSNDYGIALELVRPKKNNKYQKLDIEYSGLDIYDNLIRAVNAGDDTGSAIAALNSFRVGAARRSAQARLAAAIAAADVARETISKTNDTISDLQARIKDLRSKLNRQKKAVGKEPTKQSAAKILRTESQIDAANEKLRRAQRRLNNARRRLIIAEDDAAAARGILDAAPDNVGAIRGPGLIEGRASLPSIAPGTNLIDLTPVMDGAPAEDEVHEMLIAPPDAPQLLEETKINLLPEQKAEKMADEVKPLFNKDPEILDEEIAFKPIDFGTITTPPVTPAAPASDTGMASYGTASAPAPLSFAPPSGPAFTETDVFVSDDVPPSPMPSPVLDTITSVDVPNNLAADAATTVPGAAPSAMYDNDIFGTQGAQQPVRPTPISAPVPGAAAPVARPVSPVTGAPVRPASAGNDGARRPNFLYYIMLIALIVLSIFTLWLYQKNSKDTVPDLAATAPVAAEQTTPQLDDNSADNPFIAAPDPVTEPESQPAAEQPAPIPAPDNAAAETPEPAPEQIPEPIIDDTAPEVPAAPVVTEPEPEPAPESPFLTEPEPEPEPVQPVVVNKPAYNAGPQNDNMFVAAEEYETETIAPAPAQAAAPAEALVCDDGLAPDANGCCAGELFSELADGYACCSSLTGECYPPMF